MEIDDIKLEELRFESFCCEDVDRLREYFFLRPNKTCDSAPLDSFIWREYYNVKRCVVDENCFLIADREDGVTAAALPLCKEDMLSRYFKLLERYFNEVLKKPLVISLADEDGVERLRAEGALDGYEIREEEDLKDYLYDAESLRTLKGRKLAKKRNHIHKFEETYAGRWEYRALNAFDRSEILEYLALWKEEKDEVGEEKGVGLAEQSIDATDPLDAEVKGVQDILSHGCVFDNVKIGGIFIDGKLKAFSIGNYNPREEMAIIDIEKADPNIVGLYQLINREFLIHEFPEAKLVNREDDAGIEGLRKAKLSYHPIGYARKYMLKQKDFME